MAWDDGVFRNTCCNNRPLPLGISLYAIDGAHASSNNKVYNNNDRNDPELNVSSSISGMTHRASAGWHVVENNILVTPDSFHGSI